MKKGFLHRWLENRAARKRTLRSLAYNIELCRNSARRAIEKAQAGKTNYSMLKAARTANRDAMEACETLWMISGGKLTKKELALFESAENLYQEIQEAEQAIEDAKKIGN